MSNETPDASEPPSTTDFIAGGGVAAFPIAAAACASCASINPPAAANSMAMASAWST